MQDGAAPYFSLLVREHLNRVYSEQWIGRSGPVSVLWGDLERRVYDTPAETEADFLQRIRHYRQEMKNNIQILL